MFGLGILPPWSDTFSGNIPTKSPWGPCLLFLRCSSCSLISLCQAYGSATRSESEHPVCLPLSGAVICSHMTDWLKGGGHSAEVWRPHEWTCLLLPLDCTWLDMAAFTYVVLIMYSYSGGTYVFLILQAILTCIVRVRELTHFIVFPLPCQDMFALHSWGAAVAAHLNLPNFTQMMSWYLGRLLLRQSLQNQLPSGMAMLRQSGWNAAGHDSQHSRLPPTHTHTQGTR